MILLISRQIIIAQESLGQFINLLCPNAYTSLTKVDFKKLDNLKLQPLGVYGPKESLFSFLVEMGITDFLRYPLFHSILFDFVLNWAQT